MVEIRKQNLNGVSNLSGEGLKALYEEIRDLYLSDDRPWIIGYSGGKDSTTALQAIWYAISELPREKRGKMIFVISSDTLVETPVIVDYIDNTLNRINEAAKTQGMPFQAEKVMPLMEDSFWTNLIGRGYPAPTTTFRWCTERMKIDPANRFILERVAEYGEVIMVLGVRSDESATRAQVMSLHKITGNRLKRHSTLPRAYVYTPIENFTTNDVWTYLLQWNSPWGNNNRDLVALYKNSQAGECPLVIDTTTPSCGNSRFGCWVCTVVTQDKAMESMIDNGEYWMEPLLELRDWLAATQDPEKKRDFRDYKRRNGRIMLDRSNEQKVVPGPYFLKVRQEILRMVLQAQQSVRENGPDPNATLIHPEELHEIRRIWRMEEQDWEDSVPKIYREIMGDDLIWVEDDTGSFTPQDRSILEKICEVRNIPPKLVMKLLDVELSMNRMAYRSNISKKLEAVLAEEWQTEEEAIKRELKRRSRKASVQR